MVSQVTDITLTANVEQRRMSLAHNLQEVFLETGQDVSVNKNTYWNARFGVELNWINLNLIPIKLNKKVRDTHFRISAPIKSDYSSIVQRN